MTRMPGWETLPAPSCSMPRAARCPCSTRRTCRSSSATCSPRSVADCARVIRDMNVRGAPLIGLVAAAGMAFAARADASDAALEAAAALLIASRPTAVNLRWAVQDLQAVLRAAPLAARADARRTRACWPCSTPNTPAARASASTASASCARSRTRRGCANAAC